MEHCDFCNEETSFKAGTYYSASEVVNLLQNGIELDVKMFIPAIAMGISKESLLNSLPHEISILPQTGWLFCPVCASKANKHIPKSAGNMPEGEQTGLVDRAGIGKMPVVILNMGQTVLMGGSLRTSAPVNHKCDFCSKVLPRTSMTFTPSNQIQAAVKTGFHPFGKSGIATGAVPSAARIQQWQQQALQDTTDWGLCPDCSSAFSRYALSPTSKGGCASV